MSFRGRGRGGAGRGGHFQPQGPPEAVVGKFLLFRNGYIYASLRR